MTTYRKVTTRLPEDLVDHLTDISEKTGISVTSLVVQACLSSTYKLALQQK